MIVVFDTSPLNYLILVGCIDVLPQLFGQVYAPSSVVIELGHPRSPEPVRTWAALPPEWLNLKEPAAIDSTLNLDPGETAAIALAEELKADRLLIDERDGRDVAKQRGLSVVGTLNVLNEAAELDLIDLPKVIEQLRATNFHVTERLIQDILQLDQERRFAREQERDRGQGIEP
jgi:predicted nucleic acid-binding protein